MRSYYFDIYHNSVRIRDFSMDTMRSSIIFKAAALFFLYGLFGNLPLIVAADSGYSGPGPNAIEMARFSSQEEAEEFRKKIQESGYTATVDARQSDYRPVYVVTVQLRPAAGQSGGAALQGVSTLSAPAAGTDQKPSWSVLGGEGRLVHGAISLTGVYTDNAFNTARDRVSDFTLFLTPEIWLNIPRSGEKTNLRGLSLRTAGGSLYSTPFAEQSLRLSAFLHYTTDIPLSSKKSPYSSKFAHKISGALAYRGNNFILKLGNQYELDMHEREAGLVLRPGDSYRYNANRFAAGLVYDGFSRLRFELEYSHFMLRYRSSPTNFRNRTDNALLAAVHYKFRPKTSIFLEYSFWDIAYRSSSPLDSKEHYLLAGLQWDMTSKSKGLLKAGYGSKRFSKLSGRYNNLFLEAQLEHRLTPRSALALNIFYRPNETNLPGTKFASSKGIELRYRYLLTVRTTLSAYLSYSRDTYRGSLPPAAFDRDISSSVYQAGVDLLYEFRRWLKANAGYAYTRKRSTEKELEFYSNTFFFRITGYL